MLNGKNFLNEMEFEQRLEEMGADQLALLKFIARNQYEMSKLCPIHDRDIKHLQNRSKKEIGASGGIGAIIGAALATAIDYFMRR